jgi:hypothetical protein
MRRIALFTALIAALTIAALPAAHVLAAKPRMSPAIRAELPGKRLFDIGVADPDNDGWQDIFTTNHKFASVFLRNHRGRSFHDQIDELGIGPDARFPGLDLLRAPDDVSQPGVYIWPTDAAGEAGRLHISSTGLTASGQLKLMTKNMTIRSKQDADAALGRDADGRPFLDFTLRPGGEVTVSSNGLSDLPILFDFADSGTGAVSTGEIKVGTDATTPDDQRFQFKLRDRHGLAFADVAGDRDEDVFVATGGLGGGIAHPRYLGYVADQLLISGAGAAGGYANRIDVSGIVKADCRGRSASYADPDGGGYFDLMTTCEGQVPRLWAQTLPGGFVQVPSPPVIGRTYRWASLDRGPPVLLVSTKRGLEVWHSVGGAAWRRSQTVRAGAEAGQIALGDYDNSGTLDVLVTGGRHVALLANEHGRLHPVGSRTGLPRKAAAGSFVDYDNDGRLDLSFAPQGLYRWDRHRKRYVGTGAMRLPRTGYAIVEWMDYDNDGRRDPLIATSKREFSPRSRIVRRRNMTRAGHWLEVDLTGTATNREALGASVRITTGSGGRRLTQWVGQNDDARHSQGHYRLYFGLGKAKNVRRLVVHWSDGRTTRLRRVRGDRLLRIAERRSRHRSGAGGRKPPD